MPIGALIPAIAALILPIAKAVQTQLDRDAAAARSNLEGVVANSSKRDYKVEYYTPRWGKFDTYPGPRLEGALTATKDALGKAREALGDGASEADLEAWVFAEIDKAENKAHEIARTFIKRTLKVDNPAQSLVDLFAAQILASQTGAHLADPATISFTGSGRGGGTELCLLLTDENDADHRIALMVRHRPGGYTGAGISMSNGSWFTDSKYDKASDPDGSEISDHIQSISTDVCQFSTGDPITTRLNGIKVSVTAAKSALFSIEDDD
jgi:hypothetical protein